MHADLDVILSYLKELTRPVIERLEEGLSHEEIDRYLSKVSLTGTQDLYELFSWRNGTKVQKGDRLDDLHFFPGFYFMAFEDAISQYALIKSDVRWKLGWFPIFSNDGGDFYVVDLANGSANESPVIGFMVNDSEHRIEYQSLTTMVATIRECFEKEVFFVDKNGYQEANDREHAKIARKNNPTVSLWQH